MTCTTNSWPGKLPTETLDYYDASFGEEFALYADLSGTDSIESITVVEILDNTTTSPLLIDSQAFDANKVLLWISGGLAGEIYQVHIQIRSALGRIIDRYRLLPIKEPVTD